MLHYMHPTVAGSVDIVVATVCIVVPVADTPVENTGQLVAVPVVALPVAVSAVQLAAVVAPSVVLAEQFAVALAVLARLVVVAHKLRRGSV